MTQPIQLDPREMLGFKLDAAAFDGAKMGAKSGDKAKTPLLGAKQGSKDGEKQAIRAGSKLGSKQGSKQDIRAFVKLGSKQGAKTGNKDA